MKATDFKGLVFFTLLFSLAACRSFTTYVRHPQIISPEKKEALDDLRNIYVLVRHPVADSPTEAQRQQNLALEESLKKISSYTRRPSLADASFIDAQKLGRWIASELRDYGYPAAAWQTGTPEDARAWSPYIRERALLNVGIHDFQLASSGTIAAPRVSGELLLSFSLVSRDGGVIVEEQFLSLPIEQTLRDEDDVPAWFKHYESYFLQIAARDIVRKAAPFPILRVREVRSEGGHPLLRKGYDAAWKNDWIRAEEFWGESESQEDTPLVFYNLGIAGERAGRYEEAFKKYEAAEAVYRKNGRRPPKIMAAIKGELKTVLDFLEDSRKNRPSEAWFEKQAAVLPLEKSGENDAAWTEFAVALSSGLVRKGYRVAGISPSPDISQCGLLIYAKINPLTGKSSGLYLSGEFEAAYKAVDAASGAMILQDRITSILPPTSAPSSPVSGLRVLSEKMLRRIPSR